VFILALEVECSASFSFVVAVVMMMVFVGEDGCVIETCVMELGGHILSPSPLPNSTNFRRLSGHHVLVDVFVDSQEVVNGSVRSCAMRTSSWDQGFVAGVWVEGEGGEDGSRLLRWLRSVDSQDLGVPVLPFLVWLTHGSVVEVEEASWVLVADVLLWDWLTR
jgi:hypothetical protein